jgi:tetratricopeptide (TPR) repeat protein
MRAAEIECGAVYQVLTVYKVLTSALLVSSFYAFAADVGQSEVAIHTQKAQQALARHELKLATEEYEKVLRLDPKNAQISAALGIARYALGEPAKAIDPLKAALALDPSQTSAEAFLALSLAELARCGEAVPLLQKHFTEQADSKVRRIVGLSLLGCIATSANPENALDTARLLKRWYPSDEDVLYQTAELYSQLSRQTVNALLEAHPESYRVHQLAGEAFESQNNDNQALIEYRKALELNPKAPHMHYRIGEILLRTKENPTAENDALQQFEKEIDVNPGDAPSEYQIAEIQRRRNQLEVAQSHFERALQLNPAFVEAHIGLAKVFTAQRNFDRATPQAIEAVRLSPDDPGTHYALMVIYRETGRAEDAQKELSTVENLNAQKKNDFRTKLQVLLTGQRDSH